MIKDVEIRVANADDIFDFFGAASPHTCYAWVASYKNQVACLAGVILKRGQAIPFSDIKNVGAPKTTIWKTAKELLRLMKSLGLPLVTATEGRCSPFLESLGFTHGGHNQGWEIYKCQC